MRGLRRGLGVRRPYPVCHHSYQIEREREKRERERKLAELYILAYKSAGERTRWYIL